MLIDWIHWLSFQTWNELSWLVVGFFLVDGPRYVLSTTAITLWDWLNDAYLGITRKREPEFTHCPSVCVLIVGLNEGRRLRQTLDSVGGTYPRLEIVVCDDGSTDDMSTVARSFMHEHSDLPMQVITRPWRGGKSSALNLALGESRSEIVVALDGDSHVEADTIWEIVQPFADPNVGITSGMIRARNWSRNLCTWLQAFEYLRSILIGRRVSSQLGILSLSSGALSAYRRTVLDRLGGWDIGPGEDLDIALRTRKLGYTIAFSQFASCRTEVPSQWKALIKQRFRWDGDNSVRHYIRKHNGLTNFTWKNFRFSNFLAFWDAVIIHLFCSLGAFLAIVLWPFHHSGVPWVYATLTIYVVAVLSEIPALFAILYYSRLRRVDLMLGLAVPVMPFYRLFLIALRVCANLSEIFWRSSYHMGHVPTHVREATWRW